MAIIGTFTQTENGYTGHIRTLTCNVQAHFAPAKNGTDKGPAFRIFSANFELGAAWYREARDTGRQYLSIKLDDPSFPQPIFAALVESEVAGTFNLLWNRPTTN
jgi:uncharacterized protein (DUF736 family)